MVLANIDIRFPIVLGGILYCSQSLYLFLFMPEDNFKPTPIEKKETFNKMKKTFIYGLGVVKADMPLLIVMITAMVFGMFSEGFDRLWTPFFINDFSFPALGNLKPVAWFGFISLFATAMAILMTGIIEKKTNINSRIAIIESLIVLNLSLIVMVMTFAMSSNFIIAASAYCFAFMFKEGIGPLSDSWINQNLESGVRATIFSFHSQINSFGQILGGPVLGLIATAVSIKTGIIAAGLILIPSFFLYSYLLKEHKFRQVRA